jgi:hypothetical protein
MHEWMNAMNLNASLEHVYFELYNVRVNNLSMFSLFTHCQTAVSTSNIEIKIWKVCWESPNKTTPLTGQETGVQIKSYSGL